MQIVIDIPKSILNTIEVDEMLNREQLAVLQIHILNGTPLPKGHGRLIDVDKALDYFTTNMNWVDEEDNRIDNSEERKAIFKEYFDGVSTILEADMNREGEK